MTGSVNGLIPNNPKRNKKWKGRVGPERVVGAFPIHNDPINLGSSLPWGNSRAVVDVIHGSPYNNEKIKRMVLKGLVPSP